MHRLTLLLVVMVGCSPGTGRRMAIDAGSADVDRSPPVVTAGGIEEAVHGWTNAARRDNDVAEVALDTALASVARRHASDMAARGYIDHVTPEGIDPNGRAARTGMECRVRVSETRTRVGFLENLFQGGLYVSTSVTIRHGYVRNVRDWLTADEIGGMAVDRWLDSPDHRANLLDARMNREGIGAAVATDMKVYVTQMLC